MKRRGKDGALGQTSLKVLEGPMEPFTHTLAVQLMNQRWALHVLAASIPYFFFDDFIHFKLRYNSLSTEALCIFRLAMMNTVND